MDAILSFLRTCVREEAEVLLEDEIRAQGRKRKSRKLEAQCTREAEEHFAEEVSEMVIQGSELTPWTVISYRRKPKVWAIAGAIRHQIRRETDA